MPSAESPAATPAPSPVLPAVVQIPVNVEVPANLLPLFTSIKKAYGASDAKVVGDCLRFALLAYQQGMVAPSDNLLDALINQMAGFKLLRERIEQSVAAGQQACYVSSAIVKSLEIQLAAAKAAAAKKE